MTRAKIISIAIEEAAPGLFHATSPQVEGLFISGETLDELKELVPFALAAIFEMDGEAVSVMEADDEGIDIPMPWIIVRKNRECLTF